jgi:hypothetical protein
MIRLPVRTSPDRSRLFINTIVSKPGKKSRKSFNIRQRRAFVCKSPAEMGAALSGASFLDTAAIVVYHDRRCWGRPPAEKAFA